MTWLARLTLSRDDVVRQGLFDSYDWHQAAWQCFPAMCGQQRDFLMRLDWLADSSRLYLLSGSLPSKPAWCPSTAWALKEIPDGFLDHTRYRFDLLANPTKKLIIRDSSGVQTKGRRVPLLHEYEQRQWLEKKGRQHGFCIFEDSRLAIDPAKTILFRRKNIKGSHVGVRFRGVLSVTDHNCFSEAFRKGIGSAKAFGFGMLLLQPLF